VSVRLCFGYVGTGGRRFCLKPLKSAGTMCGVLKHAAKFEPKVEHYYLRSNDITAFYEPCFPMSLIPDELRGEIHSDARSIEEWKVLFLEYIQQEEAGPADHATANRYLFPDPAKFALKTPKKYPFF